MSHRYTLVIGNKNYSSWSMRPWVWMRRHNIPFDTHRIPLMTATMAASIARFGCGSTVPILVSTDAVGTDAKGVETKVWDSLAILEYLAERHPQAGGWPAEAESRARARSISAEMHAGFAAVRSTMPMNCRRVVENFMVTETAQREVERINRIFTDCRSTYASDGDFLFGQYTIADAMYAPVVMRFNTYGVSLEGLAAAYVQTMSQQAEVIEWMEDSRHESEVIDSAEV